MKGLRHVSVWSAFLLFAAILLPGLAAAQVERAEVTVLGMSCPFCAFGVEKKLKDVAEVAEVSVDMAESTATVIARPGTSLRIEALRRAVLASGFTPGDLSISAVGTVEKTDGENLLLDVGDSEQRFHLVNLRPPFEGRLRELAGSGKPVRIFGRAHEHVEELPALSPLNINEELRIMNEE